MNTLILIALFIVCAAIVQQQFDGWFANPALFWLFVIVLSVILVFGGIAILLAILGTLILVGAVVASLFGGG